MPNEHPREGHYIKGKYYFWSEVSQISPVKLMSYEERQLENNLKIEKF